MPTKISMARNDGYIGLNEQMEPTLYYYMKDHLGNVRVVFKPNPDNTPLFTQANEYYPFGMTYTKSLATQETANEYVNKFLYNSKEQQEMPGKWYDYGARFYDAQLGRFHTLDPLSENYSFQSPFVYAANNPIRFIDWMGMNASPYYDEQGNFLGVDENGFAGEIYVTNQESFDANSTDGVANSETIQANENTGSIGTANLSDEALSNVYTDVITKMDEIVSNDLYNGKVSIFNGKGDWDYENGGMIYAGFNDPDGYWNMGHSPKMKGKVTVGTLGHSELTTVENVQNALGVHELIGHGFMGIPGNETRNHAKAYEIQMAHPTWEKTTPEFQKDMIKRYNKYLEYDD